MIWQTEHDELLRDMIAKGHTFREVAAFLNAKYGFQLTRNACIGRAHRKKFPGSWRKPPAMTPKERQQYQTRRRKEKRWANLALAYRIEHTEQPRRPGGEMRTLIDLDPNDCRYPSGEGASITFCAAPQLCYVFRGELRRSSYCREHHFKCTIVTSEARAAA